MKKLVAIIVALLIVLTITVFAVGPLNAVLYFIKPHHSFQSDERAVPLDYSQAESWAALPSSDDLTDGRPEGVSRDTALDNIDVFFIHPTGYLRGDHWNAPMDMGSATEENTQWMMANQASAFSDGRVYAPRYRQATIYAFFDVEGDDEQAALDLAYQDVVRAFEYFLANHNEERPFILASHSQGTFHAQRLLREVIDPSDIHERLIAAYLIGMSTMTHDAIAKLSNIEVCDAPDQTGCLIHWATFADGTPPQEGWDTPMICVNPITWRADEVRAEASAHLGNVPASGIYNLDFRGADEGVGATFDPLGPPQPQHTFAYCKDGRLFVAEQPNPSMALGKGNYHGFDFQLFHMDIRKNLGDRVRAFSNKRSEALAAHVDGH